MALKSIRKSARIASGLVLGLATTLYGCSSSDDGATDGTGVGGTPTGVGGQSVGVGGATSGLTTVGAPLGGATAITTSGPSTGGSNSSTGGSDSSTGGSDSSTGGATAKGGTTSTGGTTAKGGTTSTGGTTAKGGTTSTGGTTAKGGTASTGGTSATGGTSNTSGYDTSISQGEFSFFVISPAVIKANSPGISCDTAGTRCTNSLGGNLGGLTGADALCTKAAQAANPGDNHQWRAFLSTSTVSAISRIGKGPWYSAPPKYQSKTNYASEGLLFGSTTTEITSKDRPGDSTTVVWNGTSPSGGGLGQSKYNWPFNTCYLDEKGACTTENGDSHDTNTGSTTSGTYAGTGYTCSDWTSAASSVKSKNGHSWCRDAGCNGMNWISSSNESHPCLGIINMTTANESTGIGSGGGYGGFYCFAVSN